jgi:hypothetical protein
MNKTVLFGVVLAVLVVLGVIFMMNISYGNAEVRLRNQIAAQQDANTLVYDKVWKVIAQKAQVTDQAKDSFKEIYIPLMEGRYKQGGQMMKWIQEQNPQFDQSIYKDLMNSIEGLRTEFQNVQIKLRDLKREHDNLLDTAPSRWFLSGREKIKVQLVTSGKTSETFSTGEENDVDVFGRNKKAEK